MYLCIYSFIYIYIYTYIKNMYVHSCIYIYITFLFLFHRHVHIHRYRHRTSTLTQMHINRLDMNMCIPPYTHARTHSHEIIHTLLTCICMHVYASATDTRISAIASSFVYAYSLVSYSPLPV